MPRPGPTAPSEPNPFFTKWPAPFGVPPFDQIKPEHYLPAFRAALSGQMEEVRAIHENPEPPGFGNTIAALEASGAALDRVSAVFSAMAELDADEALDRVALAVAPMLSNHQDDLLADAALFARITRVHAAGGAGLDAEDRTLLETTWRRFRRGGAELPAAGQARLRALNAELALLELKYEDNLKRETDAFQLVIHRRRDLEGLPERELAAAQERARMAGLAGSWVFDLHGPCLWPFLEHAGNRDLRRQMLQAYLARCDGGGVRDNAPLAARIAALRCEKARLLGYSTYAHYALEEKMARAPEQAFLLLDRIREPALRRARTEGGEYQALLEADEPRARLEAWDWRYYATRARRSRLGADSDGLRPYFSLEQVQAGAFRTAGLLYGITFTERPDLPTYHREARAFLVRDGDGRFLGIYFTDHHPRPGKRGGAWMGNFRRQCMPGGRDHRPVVYSAANFPRPRDGTPSLLSPEEVRTLFHEFGHALHALLSRCRYRSLSGAAAAMDFSEMPSQIMENWAVEPKCLAQYARHWQTGAPLPRNLAEGLREGVRFNQGFLTSEYLAAAYLDLEWHSLRDPAPPDAAEFEEDCLIRMGLPAEIPPRYRLPSFAQSLGGECAAGYYDYLWAAVLDSDAYQAFREKGDPFDPATARAFRTHILERGASEDPLELFRRFRGRPPVLEPLLRKRGLG